MRERGIQLYKQNVICKLSKSIISHSALVTVIATLTFVAQVLTTIYVVGTGSTTEETLFRLQIDSVILSYLQHQCLRS